MAQLAPSPRLKFHDSNGNVLVSGKLYTYAAGTSTPLATYTDSTEGAQNTNPIILDSNGEAVVWLGPLAYKFVLKDSANNTLWTQDNIATVNSGTITTGKLADGVLSADTTGRAKMADGFITEVKLADGALSATTAGRLKMADGFITTAKIGANQITRAKLEAVGQAASSSCGAFTTTSTTYTDVTNLSVSLTTTGRPVVLALVSDSAANSSRFTVSTTTSGTAINATIRMYDTVAAAEVADCFLGSSHFGTATLIMNSYTPAGTVSGGATFTGTPATLTGGVALNPPLITASFQPNFMHIYAPSAGSHTWKIQAKCSASSTLLVNYIKLVAYEL